MTSKNLSINYQKLERTQRLWAFWILLYLAAMSVLSFTFEMFSLSDYHAVTSDLIGVPDVRSFCYVPLFFVEFTDFYICTPEKKQTFFSASHFPENSCFSPLTGTGFCFI